MRVQRVVSRLPGPIWPLCCYISSAITHAQKQCWKLGVVPFLVGGDNCHIINIATYSCALHQIQYGAPISNHYYCVLGTHVPCISASNIYAYYLTVQNMYTSFLDSLLSLGFRRAIVCIIAYLVYYYSCYDYASRPIGSDQSNGCVTSTFAFGLGCGHCLGIRSTIELCRFCVLSLHKEAGGVRQYTRWR